MRCTTAFLLDLGASQAVSSYSAAFGVGPELLGVGTMTSIEAAHRTEERTASPAQRVVHMVHSNIGLDLTNTVAAQRVLWPRRLLPAFAAQATVRLMLATLLGV